MSRRDVLEIWRDVRVLFSGRPSVDAQVTPAAVASLEQELAALFAVQVPDRRFALPDDYRRWLPHLGCHTNRGGDWGFYWYTPAQVAGNTASGLEIYDHTPPQERQIWLEIAHWSDKHDIFLCCDPDDPRFGWLVDAHDNHPWLDPESLTLEASSLTRYLSRQYPRMRRERRAHRKVLVRAWLETQAPPPPPTP